MTDDAIDHTDCDNSHDDDGMRVSRRDLLKTGAAVSAGVLASGIAGKALAAKPAKIASVGTPKSMLVKNCQVLVTMDKDRREIPDGGIYIEEGVIKQVGPTKDLPKTAQEVLDLKGHVVAPGLINTHHHLYQHLTRVVPACQDGNVWNWLRVLYPMWAKMNPVCFS
jgi:hypothetical protein